MITLLQFKTPRTDYFPSRVQRLLTINLYITYCTTPVNKIVDVFTFNCFVLTSIIYYIVSGANSSREISRAI